MTKDTGIILESDSVEVPDDVIPLPREEVLEELSMLEAAREWMRDLASSREFLTSDEM